MEISTQTPLNIPIPDPSELTMKNIEKVEFVLRRDFEEKINLLSKFTDQRVESLKELVMEQNRSGKEANLKTESNFQKDIDSLKEVNALDRQTYDSRLNTITDRVSRREAAEQTVKENKTETHIGIGSSTTIISCAMSAIALIFSIVIGIHNYSASPALPPTTQSLAYNPTLGADTKRVDDLIANMQSRDREVSSRFDELSSRLSNLQTRTNKQE